MSTQIPFDTFKQRLSDQNLIKPKAIKDGFVKLEHASVSKNTPDKAQGSAEGKANDLQVHLLNRKVDYHIEQGSNELVIKIRDGETGEVIRQIPEEEFLRLSNRISVFNKGILDKTV
jgi:flagellar protein FlaG